MAKVEHQLRILETLEREPDTTQASLAAQLGVAVGTINWHLKRMMRKGYIKAKQMERRKLRYFVTPTGLALKARLTKEYMEVSLRVYRELRQAARETLAQVRDGGYATVKVNGRGEAMEIFGLTCLEEGMGIEKNPVTLLPEVWAEGTRFVVEWPE